MDLKTGQTFLFHNSSDGWASHPQSNEPFLSKGCQWLNMTFCVLGWSSVHMLMGPGSQVNYPGTKPRLQKPSIWVYIYDPDPKVSSWVTVLFALFPLQISAQMSPACEAFPGLPTLNSTLPVPIDQQPPLHDWPTQHLIPHLWFIFLHCPPIIYKYIKYVYVYYMLLILLLYYCVIHVLIYILIHIYIILSTI